MNFDPNMLMKFLNFRNNFRGDPYQMVQQLLNSGQITQEQYNKAVEQAKEFQGMIVPFMKG